MLAVLMGSSQANCANTLCLAVKGVQKLARCLLMTYLSQMAKIYLSVPARLLREMLHLALLFVKVVRDNERFSPYNIGTIVIMASVRSSHSSRGAPDLVKNVMT